jgi:hypothetical protein
MAFRWEQLASQFINEMAGDGIFSNAEIEQVPIFLFLVKKTQQGVGGFKFILRHAEDDLPPHEIFNDGRFLSSVSVQKQNSLFVINTSNPMSCFF